MTNNWTFDVSEQHFVDSEQRFDNIEQHFDDGEQCFDDSQLNLDDGVHQGQAQQFKCTDARANAGGAGAKPLLGQANTVHCQVRGCGGEAPARLS